MARLKKVALVAVVCSALLVQAATAYSFNFGGGKCLHQCDVAIALMCENTAPRVQAVQLDLCSGLSPPPTTSSRWTLLHGVLQATAAASIRARNTTQVMAWAKASTGAI